MDFLYTIHTKCTYDLYKEYKYKLGNIYQMIARLTLLYAVVCMAVILFVYWKTGFLFLQFLLFIPLLLVALLLKKAFQVKKSWRNLPLIEEGSDLRTDFYENHLEQITDFTKRMIPYEKFCGIVVGEKGIYLMLAKSKGLVLESEKITPELLAFIEEKIKKSNV